MDKWVRYPQYQSPTLHSTPLPCLRQKWDVLTEGKCEVFCTKHQGLYVDQTPNWMGHPVEIKFYLSLLY